MERNIYIVGAHSRARTLGVYLAKTEPDIRIKAYLYDNDEPNMDNIEGVPVIRFVSSCSGRKAQTDGHEGDHSCHAAAGYGTAQSLFKVILRGNGQEL